MQLYNTEFLHKPIYMSVCRTIHVSGHQVWPIVLHGKTLLHIPVQCRTGTQLLPHLSTRKLKVLFCDFPTCRPTNLPVRCWYYTVQEDAWLPVILKQPIRFSISTLRPHILIH